MIPARPRAATGGFPYTARTVAEVWGDPVIDEARLHMLDLESCRRTLTRSESLELEKLVRRVDRRRRAA
jgi:hypothetical protein